MGTLFVVRHARAGSRSEWDCPDSLRPLDDKGTKQAHAICDLLAGEGVRRLVSSPAVRCVDTLAPLADRLGLEVEVDERLAEGQGSAGALALAEELRGTSAAMCSHGDVVPDLLDALEARGLALPARRKWQKASTWALTWDGDRLAKATYLPPPSV